MIKLSKMHKRLLALSAGARAQSGAYDVNYATLTPTPTGTPTSQALYLGGSSRKMTLPTLQRLAALVEAGATVVGMAPEGSPSLNDDAAAFKALTGKLWAGGAVTKIGAGQVIAPSTSARPIHAKSAWPSHTMWRHTALNKSVRLALRMMARSQAMTAACKAASADWAKAGVPANTMRI
jgi:hypothetical protein